LADDEASDSRGTVSGVETFIQVSDAGADHPWYGSDVLKSYPAMG